MSSQVPADFEATRALADWRDRVWWPISIGEANRISVAQVRRALAWVANLGDGLARDSCLLTLPNLLGYGRAIMLAALATSRAAETGQVLVGSAPELAYLRGRKGEVPVRAGLILPLVQARFQFVRRLARVHSWTGIWALPKAVISPEAVAITHNSLLRAAAGQSSKAIGFQHAQMYLNEARDRNSSAGPSLLELALPLAKTILGDGILAQPYRSRALDLMKALARLNLENAARDMHALRATALPGEVWTGSGGPYAPRAVGLEVLRRGGRVVRFGHGAPISFINSREIDGLLEMAVSSEVVLCTERAAGLWRERDDQNLLPWHPRVEVRGMNGDPTYAQIPARRPRRARQDKLRVVYAPTQLLGFRQLLPCQPPDVVYLHWQLQVAEALRSLPVEFICQPHPEGLLQDTPHPLEAVASTIRGNFGVQLRLADVFVFDYAPTTALWEAACTDSRIVFLDIGAGKMTPPVAKLFRKRARVVKIEYGDGNRPILKAVALRDAVLGESGPVDPMPLRALLAGSVGPHA